MRQTYVMRVVAEDRPKWMLGNLLIASAYSAAIGEELYPYSLLLFLFSVIVAASIFGRVATTATLVVSCLVVAYFVIPPVFSFRIRGGEFPFFVAYVSAAMAGCAVMQLRHRASRARTASGVAATTSFVLTCDSEGRLQSISPELLKLTGRNHGQVEGFQWLSCVRPHDRAGLVRIIQLGSGDTRCCFIDATGTNRAVDVLVESRFSSERLFRKIVLLTVTEVDE